MLPMSAFNNHMNPKKLKNALIINAQQVWLTHASVLSFNSSHK